MGLGSSESMDVVDGLALFLTKAGFYDELVVHHPLPEFMDMKFMEEVMKHGDGWLWIRNIWWKTGGPVIICLQMLWIELCCIPFSYTVLCVGPFFGFSKPIRDSTATLKMLCRNPSCAFLTESSIFLMKTVLMLNWLCIIL